MIRNYLKTAVRNLLRNKSHSLINIAGLVTGFAAFLLIFLVIQYEQSFDNFHKNKDRLYRVVRVGKNSVNREYRTGVPSPVTNTLRLDFPQLANAGAISSDNNIQVSVLDANGATLKKFKEAGGVFFAEPQFFSMFNFPLLEGNPSNAISDPNTVMLTKRIAEKYFGDWKNAIGKTLKMYGLNIKITGILDNPPANTDFPLGLVLSYSTLVKYTDMNNWGNISDENYCFVQLPAGYSPDQFNKMLSRFVDKHIASVNPNYDLVLQPMREMHYDERLGNFNGRTFSKDLILALSLIGLFLLVIGSVNFINLSTAQAINRAREVGVRKVLGGNRWQLVLQFLGETGIICLLSLLGSVIVTFICLPFLNRLLDIKMSPDILRSPAVILFMFCAFLLVTLLSGFYPALVLSGFNPVNALKSRITAESGRRISLRRVLVVFQFVIAQVLIIGTLVVASQMNYFRNADMGFNKEAIVNAQFPRDSLSRTKVDLLRNELLQVPGISRISFSIFTPAAGGGWYADLHSKNPDIIVNMKPADTGYFRLYDLQLAAGRIYFPSDTIREFVVNETVLKKLGWDIKEAIGKQVSIMGKTCPIVGVVRDFHVNSLRDPIDPVVMTTIKSGYGIVNAKIDPGKTKTALAAMGAIWNKNFPDYVFEYNFMDQTIADYYRQENQLAQLYKIFSGIAIFISCLGLYGLVSFMAARRKKEIGIRKVLGAPASDIVFMLSREFTILIVIAFLIASPIAWYFMHQWLQQYTYRIMIGVWFFIATILSSVLIAWLSVGYTAIRAASANPVNSLRAE
jgi:ABC-type antimicrobial peptide transport system permease subunit